VEVALPGDAGGWAAGGDIQEHENGELISGGLNTTSKIM
jgi:hypothetical protein